MSDVIIDETSQPTFVISPKDEKGFVANFKLMKSEEEEGEEEKHHSQLESIPQIKNHDENLDHSQISGGDPSTLPISSFSVPDNVDFGIEFREGDQSPLIEGPSRKGLIHHVRRSFRLIRAKGTIISMNNNEEEDLEDGKGLEGNVTSISTMEKENEEEGNLKTKCSVGILLASISCIFFATSSLIVKISSLHPMELLCVRGLLQGIFVIPIIISSGSSFLGPPGAKGLLLTRATLGSVSLIMAFNAIHLIPLADASTVIFTSPVFVSLFACVCLGEICSCFDVSMISLTILGVVLVSKPSFGMLDTGSSNSWTNIIGIFCGVFAAMLTALAFIVLRQLKHVHYSVTVFWFSTVLAVFGAVLTIALDGFTLPNTGLSVLQCLGIGVCGFLGQILLTKALQIENAGPVAVARTLDIVLSFFYQITFLHDTPDFYSYCGSVLVVACVVLTAFSRWFIELQAKRSSPLSLEPDSERDPNIS